MSTTRVIISLLRPSFAKATPTIVLITLGTIVLLSIMFTQCENPNNQHTESRINIQKTTFQENVVNLSKIVRVIRTVPLETNRNCLIGFVDKVIITQNHIYVLDRTRNIGVFIFSDSGKYINTIVGTGKGPNEINEPFDITTNLDNSELFVLDDILKKINIYDADGNFKRTVSLSFSGTHLEFINGNRLAIASNDGFLLWITDLKGKVFNKSFKVDQAFQMILRKPLINWGNKVYFVRFMDNTIYEVDQNNINEFLTIDYNDYTLSRKDYLDLPLTGMDRRIDKKYIYGIYNPGIVDSHVFFYFNHNGFSHLAVFNRMKKVTLCLRANLIFDDMFYGGFNNFTLSNSYDNHFVGVIEPGRMNLNHEWVLNQSELVINVNDNPIIVIYDFLL